MEQVEACRSEMVERMLEIEDKEDNHIGYLEAQLEGLSFVEEDKNVVDDPEDKWAKVWTKLGRAIPLLTVPPLILVVPFTSQHGEIADFVTSMPRKLDKPLMSVEQIGPSPMMQQKEKVDKNGHGKTEDKGELSPQHMVHSGAASSTSFIGVLPPQSPCRGGATLGLGPAVGGASGHMKLEPQAKLTR